jgi:branched-subunit amino acid aminotransferase/4-amino-4-deoxychorismate lyase
LRDGVGRVVWVDGRLIPDGEPVVRADDSAFAEGRGCYTSVRIQRGRARFVERHARRLRDGAGALRLGEFDDSLVARALAEIAEAAFPGGEGAVRLQLSRGADGRPRLIGIPRGLGDDPAEWRAVVSPLRHAGVSLPGGHKLTNRLVLGLAAELANADGADEALLFDARGRLVEGARSNIVVVPPDGPAATPDAELGAVAGIALQVALERFPEIRRSRISRAELDEAREIVALNAVRGARPITRLDGRAVGDGRGGPWAARLGEALGLEGRAPRPEGEAE